jgi:hypothetical protein
LPWTELPALRNQRSRTYQDNTNPLKRAWSGTLAALHYESQLDSDVYDAEVNMTPIRVDNPVFDGWHITTNGWYYALGKDLANHGEQDGWTGFGGRQGAHWFKFRLLRAGYLHWPTRVWDDVGGAPTYDRTNLSQQINTTTIGPNDDEIPVQTVATWSGIWATPGNGNLSVRWSANADQLKEEITVNQVSREWIEANRPPSTPLPETYFGFVFRLDWSDIPSVYRAGLLQNIDSDFTDDGENIELRDGLNRLLAFMPLSQVIVPNEDPDLEERRPLRKRFYKDGDDYYLLVGIRCDTLAGLPAGDLVFDPTVDKQVGASGDDGIRHSGDWGFSNTFSDAYLGYRDSDGEYQCNNFFRWTGVTLEGTITTSYIELKQYETYHTGTMEVKIYGVDEDNPAAPTSAAEFDADPLTTVSVDWDEEFANENAIFEQSPSLNTILQELVNSYTISNDAIMLQIKNDGPTADHYNRVYHYDGDTAKAAKLHIEYTTTAGAAVQMIDHKRRRV